MNMKAKRKNSKEFVRISGIVNKVLQTCRKESDEGLTHVWSLWDRAVGEVIAENARPAAFKGKLLLVHVASSSWMHQLQFMKKDIIEKVNDALEEPLVEEIKFKIGAL